MSFLDKTKFSGEPEPVDVTLIDSGCAFTGSFFSQENRSRLSAIVAERDQSESQAKAKAFRQLAGIILAELSQQRP